jgi:hypothetical protein
MAAILPVAFRNLSSHDLGTRETFPSVRRFGSRLRLSGSGKGDVMLRTSGSNPDRIDRLKVAAMFVVGVLLVGNSYLITMGKVELDFLKVDLSSGPSKARDSAIIPQVETYIPPR